MDKCFWFWSTHFMILLPSTLRTVCQWCLSKLDYEVTFFFLIGWAFDLVMFFKYKGLSWDVLLKWVPKSASWYNDDPYSVQKLV